MKLTARERAILRKAASTLNFLYAPDNVSFEVVEARNGTWYIYPTFPMGEGE